MSNPNKNTSPMRQALLTQGNSKPSDVPKPQKFANKQQSTLAAIAARRAELHKL